MIEKEYAVEVVYLMLHGASEKFLAGDFDRVTIAILRADSGFHCPRDVFAEAGDTEATFLAYLISFLGDNLGIDKDKPLCFVFADGAVNYRQALRDAHLRSSKTDALGGIHSLKHSIDEFLQFGTKFRNGIRRFFENRIAVLNDLVGHLGNGLSVVSMRQNLVEASLGHEVRRVPAPTFYGSRLVGCRP